jgi:NADPH:quinone reductase
MSSIDRWKSSALNHPCLCGSQSDHTLSDGKGQTCLVRDELVGRRVESEARLGDGASKDLEQALDGHLLRAEASCCNTCDRRCAPAEREHLQCGLAAELASRTRTMAAASGTAAAPQPRGDLGRTESTKVLFLGSAGKDALVSRFHELHPARAASLSIKSLPPKEELRPLASMHARSSDVVVGFVDLNDLDSVEQLRLWLAEVHLYSVAAALIVGINASGASNAVLEAMVHFADDHHVQTLVVDPSDDEQVSRLFGRIPELLLGNDQPHAPELSRTVSNVVVSVVDTPIVAPAVVVSRFGGPEVLTVSDERPVPSVGPGQVLIRVHAVGVNPVDTYIRSGAYARLPTLPYTPGMDCSGVVAAVGEGPMPDWMTVGQPVFTARCLSGSYASYTIADASTVFPFSLVASRGDEHSGLTFEQAACIPTPYFTAYRALFHHGNLQHGQCVLVHGASGAVGLAAVELAARHGCFVVGTASSEAGKAAVLRAGAKAVVAHGDSGAITAALGDAKNAAGGFHVIVENLSNANLGIDLPLLARGGVVSVVGCRGPVEINPRDLMAREASIKGVTLFFMTPDEMQELVFRHPVGAWLRGKSGLSVSPVVGKVFHGLESASDAHVEVMEHRGGACGKIVMTIGHE